MSQVVHGVPLTPISWKNHPLIAKMNLVKSQGSSKFMQVTAHGVGGGPPSFKIRDVVGCWRKSLKEKGKGKIAIKR